MNPEAVKCFGIYYFCTLIKAQGDKQMNTRVKKHWQNMEQRLSNYGMLFVICWILFALPLHPVAIQAPLFSVGLSVVIVLSVEATSKYFNLNRKVQVGVALLAIWMAWFTKQDVIRIFAHLLLAIFFAVRVFKFIRELAKRQAVNGNVIVESINGYLLLGIALGFLVSLVAIVVPESFSFNYHDSMEDYYNPYYFALVTMTTLGYGDFAPLTNAGKSISVFIALAGQLYMVTVMALLIGRLLSSQNSQNKKKDQLQNKEL